MEKRSLRDLYGSEYPEAVTTFGIRMPLVRETRFLRIYENEAEKFGTAVSRFEDGSAYFSLIELETGWLSWTDKDRLGFAQACSELHEDPDFPDVLRFLMKHGDQNICSTIAGLVAYKLSQVEAFSLLADKLAQTDSVLANLIQAIAITKHPDAPGLLRDTLDQLWKKPDLWDDDAFLNWTAGDVIACIEYLLELGADPAEFDEKVRALNEHPCSGNRDSCRRWLRASYPWLQKAKPSRFEGMQP